MVRRRGLAAAVGGVVMEVTIHRPGRKGQDGSLPSGEVGLQPVDGREIATVAHVAIGELLATGVRTPTAE